MSYRLRFYPYSGGGYDLIDEDDLQTCRARAARRIRRHLADLEYPVSILECGRKWELETGDDAVMIGDDEGILAIEELAEPDEESCEDEYEQEARCEKCDEIGATVTTSGVLCESCIWLDDDEEVDDE